MSKNIFLSVTSENLSDFQKIEAMGNEELLAQILDNLLSNAVRHAKAKVVVAVSLEGDKVKISVTDDGSGISEADLPHIFQRGYKGANGHFGIGLSIAAVAAQKMDAKVSAKNVLPCGAEFSVLLGAAI